MKSASSSAADQPARRVARQRRAAARRAGAALAIALGLGACGGIGPPSGAPTVGASNHAAETATDPVSTDPVSTDPAAVAPTPPGVSSSGAVVASGGLPIIGDADISRLATAETPADWVEIRSNDDACRVAVPPDWIASGIPGQVLSPEIHVTSIVASAAISRWSDHVAFLQATYFSDGQEVVVETGEVFLLRSTQRGGASHVLALNGGATACGIVVAIDEAGIDRYAAIGLQILYTLAVVD